MIKNPIYLTEQELIKGITLLMRNAKMLEKAQTTSESPSPQESTLLQTLFLYPNHSAQEIAQKMQISKQSLSRILKKMHQRDFITVTQDQEDMRVKRLLLSTKGISYYTKQQKSILKIFYSAYQTAGLSAVEGFYRVQNVLAQSFSTEASK